MNHLSPKRKVVGLVLAIAAFQALMLLAFAWPASNSGPRDVPVAVAGPPDAVAQVAAGLDGVRIVDDDTAAFDVTVLDDRDAAEAAIADRDVYGAVVVTPDGPEVLIASGASPAVATMLQNAAAQLSGEEPAVAVTDLAPLNDDDPSGAGLATGVLPLALTSVAGGTAAAMLLRRGSHRAAVVTGLSVVGGLASAALLRYGLDVVDGSYWALAGVIALMIGGISAAGAGLGSLFGRAGMTVTALTMVLLGNPLSAASTAPEMLPWGAFGQLLPPGAGIRAMRSVEFFDGAAIGTPIAVLSAWAIGGLLLIFAGSLRGRKDEREADYETITTPDTGVAVAS